MIISAQVLNENTLLRFKEVPVSWDIAQVKLSKKQTNLSCLFHRLQVEKCQCLFQGLSLEQTQMSGKKKKAPVFSVDAKPKLSFTWCVPSAIHHMDGQ